MTDSKIPSIPTVIYHWWKTLTPSQRLNVVRCDTSNRMSADLVMLEQAIITDHFQATHPTRNYSSASFEAFDRNGLRRNVHAAAKAACRIPLKVDAGDTKAHPARALASVPVETKLEAALRKLETTTSQKALKFYVYPWLDRTVSAKKFFDVERLIIDIFYWDRHTAFTWADHYASGVR